MAIAPARRGAHRDEYRIGSAHSGGGIGREEQPLFAHIGLDQRL